jgi:hypothetical protein
VLRRKPLHHRHLLTFSGVRAVHSVPSLAHVPEIFKENGERHTLVRILVLPWKQCQLPARDLCSINVFPSLLCSFLDIARIMRRPFDVDPKVKVESAIGRRELGLTLREQLQISRSYYNLCCFSWRMCFIPDQVGWCSQLTININVRDAADIWKGRVTI